jgi:CheY-like chemotaxis protein
VKKHEQKDSGLGGCLRSLLRRLHLPLSRHSQPAVHGTDKAGHPLRNSVGRIIIVDLGGRIGGSLVNLLEQDGYQMRVVYDQVAALGVVEREHPDLIIATGTVDLGFCSALRYVSAVPMLVLAPQADEAQMLSAYAAGVDQYHVGPMLRRAAWPAVTS